MDYNIDFIKKEDLKEHIENTIIKYQDNLKSWDLIRFNHNLVDPIKMTFDKNVYNIKWEDLIESEIYRQRDKSNNNAIGYFHQNIFKYIEGCKVPKVGFDVIYEPGDKVDICKDLSVSRVKIEMKNKHNTMNSSSSDRIYTKLQAELLEDDDCVTMLVEILAKKSQNIPWVKTIDNKRYNNKRLRRVSIDKFYELVTRDSLAFYKLCKNLPNLINEVISKSDKINKPNDIVINQLKKLSNDNNKDLGELLYILAFGGYNGFEKK